MTVLSMDIEHRAALERSAPFLKWAGGKSQLLQTFAPLFPSKFERYFEPFVGAGAVFFRLARGKHIRTAHLADINEDLVLAYRTVRDQVQTVLGLLEDHQKRHDKEHYLASRTRFNAERIEDVERVALLIYLNKTCFNGLYRVNRKGEFNVPMGAYKKPDIANHKRLRAASAALQGVSIQAADFQTTLANVDTGDFVYLDPPYVPLTSTANFTAYAKDGFTFKDQCLLADEFRRLDKRGAKVMLSNHATDELKALYEGYEVTTLPARRMINSRADRRDTPVEEVVIRNYR